MFTYKFSDAEAYAVACALSKYISERERYDLTFEFQNLADLSNRLLEHCDDILTLSDARHIEDAIHYRR